VPYLQEVLADGKAFETSGCPDCNRPYYNESPRGVMFNYHRPLVAGEIQQAISESGVVREGEQ
jgi:biotin synthase